MYRPPVFAALLMLAAHNAWAERIIDARFESPVVRYGHFALGRPHEYARVSVTTDAGRVVKFELPENDVFEDLIPRTVRLSADDPEEILAIVSSRSGGARLMMLRLSGARLEISAESPPIGTPMRWLNPVAVVDLDGDGRAEIAAVITPHIGGTLKIYRRQGSALVEIAALDGFSNHVYGSAELALARPFLVGGKMRLLVPDASRRVLRIVGLENARLVEIGRCPLPSPIVGTLRVVSPTEVSLGLHSGQKQLVLGDCAK